MPTFTFTTTGESGGGLPTNSAGNSGVDMVDGAAVSVGDVYIVLVSTSDGTVVSTLTDNLGTTFVKKASVSNGALLELWVGLAVKSATVLAGNTLHMTWNAAATVAPVIGTGIFNRYTPVAGKAGTFANGTPVTNTGNDTNPTISVALQGQYDFAVGGHVQIFPAGVVAVYVFTDQNGITQPGSGTAFNSQGNTLTTSTTLMQNSGASPSTVKLSVTSTKSKPWASVAMPISLQSGQVGLASRVEGRLLSPVPATRV